MGPQVSRKRERPSHLQLDHMRKRTPKQVCLSSVVRSPAVKRKMIFPPEDMKRVCELSEDDSETDESATDGMNEYLRQNSPVDPDTVHRGHDLIATGSSDSFPYVEVPPMNLSEFHVLHQALSIQASYVHATVVTPHPDTVSAVDHDVQMPSVSISSSGSESSVLMEQVTTFSPTAQLPPRPPPASAPVELPSVESMSGFETNNSSIAPSGSRNGVSTADNSGEQSTLMDVDEVAGVAQVNLDLGGRLGRPHLRVSTKTSNTLLLYIIPLLIVFFVYILLSSGEEIEFNMMICIWVYEYTYP